MDLVFARDLLAGGLAGPVTFGGIGVWPSLDDHWAVCIGWSTPQGHAWFEALATTVAHFLDMTYHLVPRGTEPPRDDIDNLIAAILNSGGPPVNEAGTCSRAPVPAAVAQGPGAVPQVRRPDRAVTAGQRQGNE